MFTPQHYAGFEERYSWQKHESGSFWSAAPHVCLRLDACHPGTVGLSRNVVVTKNSMRDHNIWDTTFTKETLSAELEAHGFHVRAFYANVLGKAWSSTSETLCAVARVST
ncbi:MAG: hypothetical protein GX810_01835 [Clostridiales bacterium]|nr:hypothetical protein [Clostridiales bacterium]